MLVPLAAALVVQVPPSPAFADVDAELTAHRAPVALAEVAVTGEWPGFRGPHRDGRSPERPLAAAFGASGPPLVWERARGDGFASPAIGGGRLVFTHRVAEEVHVDCLEPESGRRLWRHSFPCDYEGRYFDNGGPRATPTIAGERVVVHGVGGVLVCLDLGTGEPVWQRDTTAEFAVGDDFFGVVSSPLVVDELVVQNVGAPGGPSVAAFELSTGALRWGAGDAWGPSCASPVLATIAGRERILVVAGGESRPPTGGLMVLSPAGALTCEVPFRSRTYTSVNGPSPVACGDGVFLTASYGVGAAFIDIDAEGACSERWRDRRGLALEFSTPVVVDGLVVAIDGVSGRAGALVAVDPATGAERARLPLAFEQALGEGEDARTFTASVGAGSLLHADGHLWVLGDTGQLVTARLVRDEEGAPSFEVVAHTALFLAPETWTPPVLAGGLLYICQNNPARGGGAPARLLCYDVRGR